MGTLTLEQFRATRQARIVGSEWVMENVGLDAEPRDMDVYMYDEGCWIERVPDGTYFVICGNMDLSTPHLENAEEFLYKNWYFDDDGHEPREGAVIEYRK